MNDYPSRADVIQACIDHQQQIAAVAKFEMDSAQMQSNDYGANVDRYDAYRTKLMRQRDMYAKQLANANAAIVVLQSLARAPISDTVMHGSIVITTKQRFFLSVGIGKFMVGSQVWYAVSAQTPIFKSLSGCVVGDTIVFNGMSQTILAVY